MRLTPSLRQEIVEWDVRNWSVALEYWSQHRTVPLEGSRTLEVGGHNGGLSLWLALQGARVVCSDLKGPTETARRLHARHGVADRIEYQAIDATAVPYENAFDAVAFKSIMGGIGHDDNKPCQRQAFGEIHKALRPGGELLFAENLVASPLHRFMRRRFVKWGAHWRYITLAELEEFLAPFSSFQYRTLGLLGTFGRREWQRSALGAIDRAGADRLVPARWRYIVVGVARK